MLTKFIFLTLPFPRLASLPEFHSLISPCCPTAGVLSVIPMVSLVQRLGACLMLPNLSCWLIWKIQLSYMVQFASCPPRISPCPVCRNCSPPGEGCNGAWFSSQDEVWVLQPIHIKSVITHRFDLCVLNRTLHKLQFKMLMQKCILSCIQAHDWFAAIDLMDAYFHVLILPRHPPFVRFAFKG